MISAPHRSSVIFSARTGSILRWPAIVLAFFMAFSPVFPALAEETAELVSGGDETVITENNITNTETAETEHETVLEESESPSTPEPLSSISDAINSDIYSNMQSIKTVIPKVGLSVGLSVGASINRVGPLWVWNKSDQTNQNNNSQDKSNSSSSNNAQIKQQSAVKNNSEGSQVKNNTTIQKKK